MDARHSATGTATQDTPYWFIGAPCCPPGYALKHTRNRRSARTHGQMCSRCVIDPDLALSAQSRRSGRRLDGALAVRVTSRIGDSVRVSNGGTRGRSFCGAAEFERPGSEIYGGSGSTMSPVWRGGVDAGGPGSYLSVAGCQSVRAVIDQVSGVTETTPSQATARISLSGSSSSGSTTVRICSRTGSASARVPGGRYT